MEKQFSEILLLIKTSQQNAYKAVNKELINLYWNVGFLITQKIKSANWGDKTVDKLAEFIQKNNPELKGFNRRGLYRMRQFYKTYKNSQFVSLIMTQIEIVPKQNDEIVSSAMTQLKLLNIRETKLTKLSWTHHLVLISSCKTDEEREFYLLLAIKENYTVKELERQINSSFYERAVLSEQKVSTVLNRLPKNRIDYFKDTYVFEFLNQPEPYSENDFKKELIKQMKNFVLELGKDFLFVDEEYRLQVGNRDFYSDLLFYHRELQCLVVFELKTGRFEPEHLGKLNFYLEALDRDVKKPNENPSIGILLCKNKDTEVVEYALSRTASPALISQYKLALPDKKLLQNKLHEFYNLIENKISGTDE